MQKISSNSLWEDDSDSSFDEVESAKSSETWLTCSFIKVHGNKEGAVCCEKVDVLDCASIVADDKIQVGIDGVFIFVYSQLSSFLLDQVERLI